MFNAKEIKDLMMAQPFRPFRIWLSDGEKYEVSDAHRIAVGRTTAVVLSKDDLPHILPLLTMTGISYLKPRR